MPHRRNRRGWSSHFDSPKVPSCAEVQTTGLVVPSSMNHLKSDSKQPKKNGKTLARSWHLSNHVKPMPFSPAVIISGNLSSAHIFWGHSRDDPRVPRRSGGDPFSLRRNTCDGHSHRNHHPSNEHPDMYENRSGKKLLFAHVKPPRTHGTTA